MSLEFTMPNGEYRNAAKAEQLASRFKLLESENLDSTTFDKLEEVLNEAGYFLAQTPDVAQKLNNSALLCRNESFSTLIELLTTDENIQLTNDNNSANICTMASGDGFRTAMTEGFAGRDVGHHIKTVITFSGENLDTNEPIDRHDELWTLKPATASVSRAASGTITPEDIEMISCRFPIHFYPEDLMSEDEIEKMEEAELNFIVRHYIKKPRTEQ